MHVALLFLLQNHLQQKENLQLKRLRQSAVNMQLRVRHKRQIVLTLNWTKCPVQQVLMRRANIHLLASYSPCLRVDCMNIS